MAPSTSQVDPAKLPDSWVSYLEKVRQPGGHAPVSDGLVLNSGCSQKLTGSLWRFGNCVDYKKR